MWTAKELAVFGLVVLVAAIAANAINVKFINPMLTKV